MRILISSLQVSLGASKGHLHPAIEIGLELKRRGHEIAILPLPSPFNETDRDQIIRCQFEIVEPPDLPANLLFSPQKLAKLTKSSTTLADAYHSFLVSPLEHQFENIIEIIKTYHPDIVVYDLLVYGAPIAARLLNIPDLGYCAGLKLIAPSCLTKSYQAVYQKLAPSINTFLTKYAVSAEFHHLELLSTSYQCVFTPKNFINKLGIFIPRRTIFAGSLPISTVRCESELLRYAGNKELTILCFGSALDPFDYPDITKLIIKIAKQFNQHLIINTKNTSILNDADITTFSYLPLPQLLKQAAVFIHHGGANTFSECLTIGVPQILIPLTNDQPIQAELLKLSNAGITLYPKKINEKNLYHAFQQLLNKQHPIHQQINQVKKLFQKSEGAMIISDLIEKSF